MFFVLGLTGLFSACEKDNLLSPTPSMAWRSDSSGSCNDYLFDSALANLLYLTSAMEAAALLVPYAAPDTNVFGWMQERFALFYQTPHPNPKPYDVIYLHGGGGDVGHAGNFSDEISGFLRAGYDVWSLEYRRGWHEGSYDPCLPRNPYAATEADFARFDTATVWAAADVRLGILFVASQTTDSLILYGNSFGGHLAIMNGPLGSTPAEVNQRIVAAISVSGSTLPDLPVQNPVPVLFIHGENDSVNSPDFGPLYQSVAAYARFAVGGRALHETLSPYMASWLIMHPGGHSKSIAKGKRLASIVERTVLEAQVPPGKYTASASGISPSP
jgi:pimeloyl-ACP methyl ester carboxylesterase